MPPFPVTVTASYNASQTPPETLERLTSWAGDADGRTFVVDDSIAPVRWTASADYVVDAPDAHAAEQVAERQFLAEASTAGIAAPETVLAATG